MSANEKTKEELAEEYAFQNQAHIPNWIANLPVAQLNDVNDEMINAFKAGYSAAEARAEAVIGIHTLVEMVSDHMDWDLPKTLQWFQTQNPLAGESTPFALYIRRPEKCVRWIQSLINEELP